MKSFDIASASSTRRGRRSGPTTGRRAWTPSASPSSKSGERDNLYKLWNRMCSGSYLPGPVRAVEIPKDHGAGVRVLGVPNTADRVAQTAAAMLLEEKLEPIFHPDSYGYRPGRSAHDALAVCRRAVLGAGLGARSRRPGLLRQRSP